MNIRRLTQRERMDRHDAIVAVAELEEPELEVLDGLLCDRGRWQEFFYRFRRTAEEMHEEVDAIT